MPFFFFLLLCFLLYFFLFLSPHRLVTLLYPISTLSCDFVLSYLHADYKLWNCHRTSTLSSNFAILYPHCLNCILSLSKLWLYQPTSTLSCGWHPISRCRVTLLSHPHAVFWICILSPHRLYCDCAILHPHCLKTGTRLWTVENISLQCSFWKNKWKNSCYQWFYCWQCCWHCVCDRDSVENNSSFLFFFKCMTLLSYLHTAL